MHDETARDPARFRRHGFTLRAPDHGRWAEPSRPATYTNWQDVIVAGRA